MNSKEKLEKIINGIYAKYAPLKSGEVSNLLRKYEGQEDELLKRICKKYGVQASDLDAFEKSYESPTEFGDSKKSTGKIVKICTLCLLGILLVLFVWSVCHQSWDSDQKVPIGGPSKELPIPETEILQTSTGLIFDHAEETSNTITENSYEVRQKTFFHDLPTEDSKRKAYLVVGERFESWREEDSFLFVEFVNTKGQKTVGWIRKDSSIIQTTSKPNSEN